MVSDQFHTEGPQILGATVQKFSCTHLYTPDLNISNFVAMRPAGARTLRTTRTPQDSHGGNFWPVTPFSLVGRCQRFRRNFCLNSLVLKMEAARSFETGIQYSTYTHYTFESSPNIIWGIKSRRMRLEGFVARMGKRVRVEKPGGKETTWKT